MADKKAAVDEVVAKQTPAKSALSPEQKKAVLARRLKALQGQKNGGSLKQQRALNRLAANLNK